MKVFNNIKFLRERLGYSKESLASLLGLSVHHIEHYETGHYNPSLDVAFRLMHVFNCGFSDIFYIVFDEEC